MSSTRTFDVIIAGAGSVGTPTAMYLAQAGFSVLVIEALPSCGQASNKHAIGGVRATHSDPSKIYLCADSINILSTWQEKYGDDIEWRSGGYSFVAYDENVEANLKSLLAVQKSLGLNIDWRSADQILQLIPGLQPKGLRGGTFSPEDGSASPLKTAAAFYKHAKASGAEFHFNEKVSQVTLANGRVNQIITDREQYICKYFINAAGSWAGEISALLGCLCLCSQKPTKRQSRNQHNRCLMPWLSISALRPDRITFTFTNIRRVRLSSASHQTRQLWVF